MTRYALRTLSRPDSDVLREARVMEHYMPSNYSAFPVITSDLKLGVLIVGEDSHGWTLDSYVLPRLASGLYAAREVTEAVAHDCTRLGAA